MYSVDNPCPSGILSSRRQLCFHQELFLKSPEHQKWGGGGGVRNRGSSTGQAECGGAPIQEQVEGQTCPPSPFSMHLPFLPIPPAIWLRGKRTGEVTKYFEETNL